MSQNDLSAYLPSLWQRLMVLSKEEGNRIPKKIKVEGVEGTKKHGLNLALPVFVQSLLGDLLYDGLSAVGVALLIARAEV